MPPRPSNSMWIKYNLRCSSLIPTPCHKVLVPSCSVPSQWCHPSHPSSYDGRWPLTALSHWTSSLIHHQVLCLSLPYISYSSTYLHLHSTVLDQAASIFTWKVRYILQETPNVSAHSYCPPKTPLTVVKIIFWSQKPTNKKTNKTTHKVNYVPTI